MSLFLSCSSVLGGQNLNALLKGNVLINKFNRGSKIQIKPLNLMVMLSFILLVK
jgi:hypothetical protein